MVKDGEADRSKALAEAWWKENEALGPDKYYLKLLRAPEGDAEFAAGKLLERDREKYLPELVELVSGGEPERKAAIFLAVAPYLGKTHEALVEPFLGERHFLVLLTAARVLWEKCGSEKGVRRVIERLKDPPDADESGLYSGEAFDLLDSVDRDFVPDAIRELMRSERCITRLEAVAHAPSFPSRAMAEALVAVLDDREEAGWSRGYKARFCDDAAESLIRLLGLSWQFELKGDAEERDRTIEALRTWWRENGERVDWDGLSEKAREKFRRRSEPDSQRQ